MERLNSDIVDNDIDDTLQDDLGYKPKDIQDAFKQFQDAQDTKNNIENAISNIRNNLMVEIRKKILIIVVKNEAYQRTRRLAKTR